jgi:hypothetical protein
MAAAIAEQPVVTQGFMRLFGHQACYVIAVSAQARPLTAYHSDHHARHSTARLVAGPPLAASPLPLVGPFPCLCGLANGPGRGDRGWGGGPSIARARGQKDHLPISHTAGPKCLRACTDPSHAFPMR